MNLYRLFASAAVVSLALPMASAHAAATIADIKDEYQEVEHAELLPTASQGSNLGGTLASFSNPGGAYFLGFEGANQFDAFAVGRGFIPPDTMGAVGLTQYMVLTNGVYAVYDKATGASLLKQSDNAFWAGAGQTGSNGDSRILFDPSTNRWVALAFGQNVGDIQIAVSDSSDALGTWQSTKFTGFDTGTFNSNGSDADIADYPTMALDTHALYIGTNNFNTAGACQFQLCGTTLNVLPLTSLFGVGGPNTTDLVQFNQPVDFQTDRGFAIQGVNTQAGYANGMLLADTLYGYSDQSGDVKLQVAYEVTFDASGKASALTPVQYLQNANTDGNGPARQPNAVPDVDGNPNDSIANNNRVVDTSDTRIGSSVVDKNGLTYAVYTNTPPGTDHTAIHWEIVDSVTKQLVSEGNIADGVHDFYQGSIAVNSRGQVVISYNRSGSETTDANHDGLSDGNITFAARVFSTNNGKLVQRSEELVLKVSLVDDYHNGSLAGSVAQGRQRWGDYSATTLDPENDNTFWAVGEWAREYNNTAGGHTGGSGGSRWSTWVAGVNTLLIAVPEPSTWSMLILGFGMIGGALRRQKKSVRVSFA